MPTESMARDRVALAEPVRRVGVVTMLGRFANRHIAPISLVILLVVLEFVCDWMKVPEYILPAPSRIIQSLIAGFWTPLGSRNGFYIHLAATSVSAAASFVGGSLFGIVMGFLVVRSAFAKRLIYPYVVSLQSVPKVALAPLFTVWFGLGYESKVVLGILLCFFPVLINTAAGLGSVDRDRLDLMAAMKASAWHTFRFVQLPSALPYIFAGLELAAISAVLGTVVGEFVGGDRGLGVLILNRNAALDIPGAMAALVVLAVMGIVVQTAVSTLRRKMLFWAPSERVADKAAH
ncbi:MAG TPA: ABC transporter permease [Devosiaceae bacterium]|jgi:NitT/TauT family transport system permease protein